MKRGVRQGAEADAQIEAMGGQVQRVIADFELYLHLRVAREKSSQRRTDQLIVLAVLMFTSQGSAGVTGSGFIILAATLASLGTIPVAGMVLLLGGDRFMSEARAITNTIGNGVGTMAIAKWVGALDTEKMNRALNGEVEPAKVESVAPGKPPLTSSNAPGLLPALSRVSQG